MSDFCRRSVTLTLYIRPHFAPHTCADNHIDLEPQSCATQVANPNKGLMFVAHDRDIIILKYDQLSEHAEWITALSTQCPLIGQR